MYIHKNEELGNWETPVIIAPYTELNLAIIKPISRVIIIKERQSEFVDIIRNSRLETG